jgi:phage shock protein A
MFQYLKKRWNYLVAKLSGRFEEKADPKVQLEQAIGEAQDQHRRLKEQAANVIAHQKQTEMRLSRTLEELERVNANARQALVMADEAQRSGDMVKSTQYGQAAETFATRMLGLEQEIEDLKALHLQSTEAANNAKAAVQQNSAALQKKLSERQQLLSQLDQAKMAEQMNEAMASLTESVGQDIPTFDEVRQKIEARYAKAKATGELTETSVENRMLEIEEASRNVEARGRLDALRAELGIGAASPGDAELGTGAEALSEGAAGVDEVTEPAAKEEQPG